MRRAILALLLAAAVPAAVAQAQPIPDTASGARPGNVIGSGSSLPKSNNASNNGGGDTRSSIAPRLPIPVTGEDAGPDRLLENARAALAAGRTGEAQESLERAESRLLDRDVDPRRAGDASRQPTVQAIAEARRRLATRDRMATMQAIDAALASLRSR